jgi:hypothetical protein
MYFYVISCNFISFHVISCHFISCNFSSFQVSLDFSDQLSIKSGGEGAGGRVCQICKCLLKPSAITLLSGQRQKH